MRDLKQLLEREAAKRNDPLEVNETQLDPIIVARERKDPTISLACALFGYGNVASIVRFLRSLDFSLLDASESAIREALATHYYRFQNSEDIIQFFTALRRLKLEHSLEELFMQGYGKECSILEGLAEVIQKIYALNPYDSRGYRFLLSQAPDPRRTKGAGTLKRWNMFLRWMVRKDHIDFGLWKGVNPADLIIPLDTHTFHVARRLTLLLRKQYDLHAALELTERLKTFDPKDPVRYDFALYRIGQEGRLTRSSRK